MTDIVERLVAPFFFYDVGNGDFVAGVNSMHKEAADEIKRLRSAIPIVPDGCVLVCLEEGEIERLRAALRSIAANTCCDRCQEAALVAKAALAKERT